MSSHPFTARWQYEPWVCRTEQTTESLARIGFFDDGLTPTQLSHVIQDLRWVTPTEHLTSEGVVLCTTGAFSPLHSGHIDMLKYAKEQLEAKGRKVAGALIQPDHDQYVSSKSGAARCAADRIHWAQDMTKDIPWIAVDPWPSIYQDRALNYTTILRRTERYLKRFGQYEVVYVFGSDNEGFKDAFLPHEYVCVPRTAISSTEVRKTMEWPVWEEPTRERPYLIRNDLTWATQNWSSSHRARRAFYNSLEDAFMDVWPNHVPKELDVQRQQDLLDLQFVSSINFDAVTGGDHWVTRLFHPCTHQYKPVDWHTSMLELIPPGKHVLVDDDIASGTTVDYIKRMTPQVEWTKVISLTKETYPVDMFDICDARDFLFGSRQGGLGIKWQGSRTRVPYILPWVNLTQRAKIPPAKQAAFTKAIIEANIRFFEACTVIVVQTGNSEFWSWLGYEMHTPMLTIAKDLLSWNPQ